MEEAEQSLDSKEDRLKNGTDPPDGAVGKFSTEIRNGDGNMMLEVKNYGAEHNSSEELMAVVELTGSGDVKDGEDEKNLKEVKAKEEVNSVKQIKNGEDAKYLGATEVVVEREASLSIYGEDKEPDDSQDTVEKNNLEKTDDEETKKEVEVQNDNETKFVVEGKGAEVNRGLERTEDASDKKFVEEVKYNNEKYGLGDVEAIGGKIEEEGSNPIDDISVKELKNGDEEGLEEMKDDEHSKPTNMEKDENSVLVQVEENNEGNPTKEAKDMETKGIESVVEEAVPDVKDERKLVVREGDEEGKNNDGSAEKTVVDHEKTEFLKRKRGKGRRPSEIVEAKKNGGTEENVEEPEVKVSRKRSKEELGSPVVSSSDRPMRERKIVERLVQVIEKGPDTTVIIGKGRGTPLKEIPNVAYNLARKKPAELKLLHQTLFGRKGKAVDFKSNLLQFSGFAWHESEERQRAKIKEKLDKCVKETLLELCDLFDLTVSKTSTKKDEIIVKVLDFLEAPSSSDVVHAEKLASNKSRKRERAPVVDASKSSGSNLKKRSRQKDDKTDGTPNSDVKSSHDTKDDEDEDSEESGDQNLEKQSQKEDEVRNHSESDAVEKDGDETDDEKEEESEVDVDPRKGKKVKKSPELKEKQDVKNSKKQVASNTVQRKIWSNSKKSSPKTDGKSSLKTPPSKHPKAEKSNDSDEKATLRKKKDAESPKKSNSKSSSKEKSSGKASKGKAKSGKEQKSGPTKAELRNSICEILKEVDFNTATFTDILTQLASEYKTDLTAKKSAIKLLIQEELTKLADEEEEEGEDDEELQ